MKISRILYKAVILILLVIICNSNICYAGQNGLPSLDDEGYKPKVSLSEDGKAMNVVVIILNVLTVLGVIAIVVSTALIGFNMILGSASEKAVAQEKFVGIIIASALITGGTIIARIIISVAESI